jgi:hypothetical protein
VATALNQIDERLVDSDNVSTSETTASTTYADLATGGPALTATTGTRALVFLSAEMSNVNATADCYASVDVSGASTFVATDARAVRFKSVASNDRGRLGIATMYDSSLTPGASTFTMKYRVSAGTGTFLNRHIAVIAL